MAEIKKQCPFKLVSAILVLIIIKKRKGVKKMRATVILLLVLGLAGCEEVKIQPNPMDPLSENYVGGQAAAEIYKAAGELKELAAQSGCYVEILIATTKEEGIFLEGCPPEIYEAAVKLKEMAKKHGVLLTIRKKVTSS